VAIYRLTKHLLRQSDTLTSLPKCATKCLSPALAVSYGFHACKHNILLHTGLHNMFVH
jgi:hypothetical protein